MGYRVGDTVRANIALYDDAGLRVSGKTLLDFFRVTLRRSDDAENQHDLLSLAEIAATGEYVLSFTPNAAGAWVLMYQEPLGTEGSTQRMSWHVGEYRGV